jgi:hypothetical protein
MYVLHWQLGIVGKPIEPPKFKVVPTKSSKSQTATFIKAEATEDSDDNNEDSEDDESKSAAKKKAKAKDKVKKNKP